MYDIFQVSRPKPVPSLEIDISETLIQMEVDTGASISLLNFSTYNEIKVEENELLRNLCRMRAYTGNIVKSRGESQIKFQYKGKSMLHNFIIIDVSSPNAFGRDVLKNLYLYWEKNI